ncbi:YrhB domain-containing protein [Nocardia altamirensis]|uniref:YrhB domain-containing protein n=1 Tax=Nocardia altamirensis TaxID=472158 RepID=UPI00143566E5|nr:YrhB domain-containing protein [Nocardia altamirensis]
MVGLLRRHGGGDPSLVAGGAGLGRTIVRDLDVLLSLPDFVRRDLYFESADGSMDILLNRRFAFADAHRNATLAREITALFRSRRSYNLALFTGTNWLMGLVGPAVGVAVAAIGSLFTGYTYSQRDVLLFVIFAIVTGVANFYSSVKRHGARVAIDYGEPAMTTESLDDNAQDDGSGNLVTSRAAARRIAEGVLAQVNTRAEPLALFPEHDCPDLGWAWVYGYTTVRWLRTGDPDAVPPPGGGPIVVVKDTADAWMLSGARDYNKQLIEYAERHGYQHTVPYR